MSSRSIFKTQQDLIKFIENDNETKSYLQKQIDPYKSYPIVLLTGMMGVGKSSISCCLSGKKLIVGISGRRKYLVGEGVGVGLNACTTLPSFLFNSKHHILFVDLPGFEDNRTTEQEISNAFAHNHIYDLFPNHRKQYKIVLVISSYDFDATKCTKLIESFARLKKMFPRYNDIKHSFGVIITKGENEFTSNDYIDFFNEKYNQTPNPSPEMNEVHRFLNTYKNNVFVFPQPTNNLIGNQYNFNDHNRLLNFLQNNYCVNPQHQIAICTNAELNLLASYKFCLDNVIKDANEILNKITKHFSIETNLVKLKRWYDFIGKILSAHIETAKDLNCIIKDNIPDGLNYDNDFKNLYDSIIFDDLISKILPTQRNTSYLNDTIKQWCQYSKDDLLIKIENAEEKEIIEQKRKEKEKREREAQRIAEKIKREEQEMKDREQKRKREIDEKERKEQEMKEKIKQVQMKIQRLSGG